MIENLWIVITTVNKPTRAVIEYSKIATRMGWRLLIVGDVKTPNEYRDIDCVFLSIKEQRRFCNAFSELVPVKHYSRKNLGYIYAIENGAEWIFDTDDDNIPLAGFAESISASRTATLVSGGEFVNIYKHFSKEPVWPRGLPLNAIQNVGRVVGETKEQRFPVQQFLADKEPDVDAIYRLTSNREVVFRKDVQPICLAPGTWSPFNSQATLFHRRQFRALYLPCFVPFRMTDIWRSFVAQRILWASDDSVVFVGPNVVQERNPHDFFLDFKDEMPGYLHNTEICRTLGRVGCNGDTPDSLLLKCYSEMQALGVIDSREIPVLEKWNSLLNASYALT